MRKLPTLIAFCIATTFALAQNTMNIYQSNGSVLQIPLSTIDSITYTLGNPGQLATLTTLPIGNIASTNATSGGNITSDGGTPVTQRGVVWSTNTNPTTTNSQTSDGSGTGNYASNLTGLTGNTTYYVRAYATNSAGTAYGNQVSFTVTASSAGYNCNSNTGGCSPAGSNAQFPTLSACLSQCVNNGPGTAVFTATWTATYASCFPAYTVVVGLGYTSNDVANETYFATGSSFYSPITYTSSSLAPGIYYYGAKKTYHASSCGTGQGITPTVFVTGSFTITAGQTTNVNIGSLN